MGAGSVEDPITGAKGFESNRDRIRSALEERNVHVVFSEIFRRLYELRNQVFHGGVAYAEGWGRTQLRHGTRIMADVVPVILDIMKAEVDANPSSQVWGKVAYPRIGRKRISGTVGGSVDPRRVGEEEQKTPARNCPHLPSWSRRADVTGLRREMKRIPPQSELMKISIKLDKFTVFFDK